MGFLDRLIGGANRAAEPLQSAPVFVDHQARAGDRLAEGGTPTNGRIVGIRRDLDDGTDRQTFAVEVEGRRHGIQATVSPLGRLRLGLPVMVRVDGGKDAVFDWAAMAAAWGLDPGSPNQKSRRKAPADGIEDSALDSRVQRRLKKWHADTATVVSVERCTAFGMATENWDVHLRLADGRTAMSAKDHVPFYAHWYAVPGASVPVAVDPGGPGQAVVDWVAVALAGTGQGPVAFDDPPPPGSIAALT
jgi:hypothetical protein